MIIAITDRKISAKHEFLEQIEEIANGSPDMIILREKDLSEPEYRHLAVECARICGYHNVDFCVNTFIKTAQHINNGRIQISFGSLTANAKMLKEFDEVWVSVHSLEEAVEAKRIGATHLIFGNVFETSCKPGAEGKGLKELADVCRAVDIPVFAVGGIDIVNSPMVMETGCAGICIRSLLMGSGNPAETILFLRRGLGEENKN